MNNEIIEKLDELNEHYFKKYLKHENSHHRNVAFISSVNEFTDYLNCFDKSSLDYELLFKYFDENSRHSERVFNCLEKMRLDKKFRLERNPMSNEERRNEIQACEELDKKSNDMCVRLRFDSRTMKDYIVVLKKYQFVEESHLEALKGEFEKKERADLELLKTLRLNYESE